MIFIEICISFFNEIVILFIEFLPQFIIEIAFDLTSEFRFSKKNYV
jgi:hypothetical protein